MFCYLFTHNHHSFFLNVYRSLTWWSLTVIHDSSSHPFTKSVCALRWMADPCQTPTRFPAAQRLRNTVPALIALHFPLRKRCHTCFLTAPTGFSWKCVIVDIVHQCITAGKIFVFVLRPAGGQKAEVREVTDRRRQRWECRQETRHLLLVVPQQELWEGPKKEGHWRH